MLLLDKLEETARTVAAVFHLLAIGVVNEVLKINSSGGRRAHRQYLVGTNAKVAVTQETVLRGRQAITLARLIEHDEVVTGTLHLGKRDSHAGIIR